MLEKKSNYFYLILLSNFLLMTDTYSQGQTKIRGGIGFSTPILKKSFMEYNAMYSPALVLDINSKINASNLIFQYGIQLAGTGVKYPSPFFKFETYNASLFIGPAYRIKNSFLLSFNYYLQVPLFFRHVSRDTNSTTGVNNYFELNDLRLNHTLSVAAEIKFNKQLQLQLRYFYPLSQKEFEFEVYSKGAYRGYTYPSQAFQATLFYTFPGTQIKENGSTISNKEIAHRNAAELKDGYLLVALTGDTVIDNYCMQNIALNYTYGKALFFYLNDLEAVKNENYNINLFLSNRNKFTGTVKKKLIMIINSENGAINKIDLKDGNGNKIPLPFPEIMFRHNSKQSFSEAISLWNKQLSNFQP